MKPANLFLTACGTNSDRLPKPDPSRQVDTVQLLAQGVGAVTRSRQECLRSLKILLIPNP